MNNIICKCGKTFHPTNQQLRNGYGKFCSHDCAIKWPTKRKKYEIIKKNKGWFGSRPAWNKDIKTGITPKNFKGESVGYDALHDWVNRHKGKACKCENCGNDKGRIEWANKSHEYKRDLEDWIQLCKKCHYAYDDIKKGKSKIKELFTVKGRNRL